MSESSNKSVRVSISAGNVKMGAIPSVSLPPVVTCPAGVPCSRKCYACRMCARRPSVRDAYARNLEILRADEAGYWVQIRAAAHVTRYFRYHVSGDIPSPEYLRRMIQTAQEEPGTEFLCFTKRYGFVNAYLDNGGEIPQNLHVIFSEWGAGWEVPNPHNLPTSAVIFKGQQPRDGWKVCGGNCFDCACRGCGCWELKNGETIAFYEH